MLKRLKVILNYLDFLFRVLLVSPIILLILLISLIVHLVYRKIEAIEDD